MVEVQASLVDSSGAVHGRWLKVQEFAKLLDKYHEWVERYGAPAVCIVAAKYELFTTDAVREYLEFAGWGVPGKNGTIFGPLMAECAKRLIVMETSQQWPSSWSKCHASPKRVWRSMVFIKSENVSEPNIEAPIIAGSVD